MIPLKLFLRYPLDGMLTRQILLRKQDDQDDLHSRPLVFDLKKTHLLFDGGRHLCAIAHDVAANQSPTFLRCSRLLLSGIAHKKLGRMMLEASHVTYLPLSARLPNGSLVLGDHDLSASHASELIQSEARYLRMRIGRDLPSTSPVMPYPMHPWTQQQADQTTIMDLRSNQLRACLIFFAGCQKRRYGTPWMQKQFHILSRLDVLRTVRERFIKDVVETSMQFRPREDPSKPPRQIRLLDSAHESITAADWLPALAESHFFLCGPGGRQPLCHNLIEGMSVGTIPILEYGDRVHPELTDGIHAICFKGQGGLVQAIERVQAMSQSELSQMRENVIAFYDNHLCGVKFWHQMLKDRLSGDQISMPFHEKNLS